MPKSYLLIGPPGSGKTTLACSGRHPTLVIDIDQKADHMANIKHLVTSGDVTIMPIRERLVEDSLQHRALNPDKGPAKQPVGYIKIVEVLNRVLDEDPEFDKYNTIVLDSLTRLVEHLKRLLIYLRAQGKFGKDKGKEGDMNWPSWGSYLVNMEELFAPLPSIKQDFICCAHQRDDIERDDLTGTSIIRGHWPLIDGQMREKLAGYFDEVYFLECKVSREGHTEYNIRTRGTKYKCARTSMALDVIEKADIQKLLEKGLGKGEPK